jgi:F420-dependent hydroxymycolic acid dehydrogenase
VTLAAVGERTSHIRLGTGVTCPTFRYNPAVAAEAFATLGQLFPGRVFLGAGAGEALNEKASGAGWGSYRERSERLVEAIAVIRRLWSGETVEHHGKYYSIESARLYDVPERPIPLHVAPGGRKACGWPARMETV